MGVVAKELRETSMDTTSVLKPGAGSKLGGGFKSIFLSNGDSICVEYRT